ncbi:helix-turn-helix domain-containing protein [Cohnella soli]|uniref:Helix-turn-helix domain-containing protein n=1 Tax=Cohnella soli TaxID=425005 RepID=A0ABW0I3N9_9BACL
MHVRKIDMVQLMTDFEGGGGIHPYHEMLFLASGNALLQWMGKEYAVSAPTLFLLAPNTPHRLLSRSATCSFGYIELDIQGDSVFPCLGQMFVWNELQTGDERHKSELYAPIYAVARTLWANFDSVLPYRDIANELVLLDIRKTLLMVTACLRAREPRLFRPADAARSYDTTETRDRVLALMRYLETKYDEPITIRELASHAHLHVSYFIRMFRTIAGTTPLQYLNNLRMNAAACFLSKTKLSVQEIAGMVGYQSIHYFSRQFKMKYTVSPTLWRECHSDDRFPESS